MPYTTHMENGRQVAGHLQDTSNDCVYCLRIFIATEKRRADVAEEKLVHWEMGTLPEDCPYLTERDTAQEALRAIRRIAKPQIEERSQFTTREGFLVIDGTAREALPGEVE